MNINEKKAKNAKSVGIHSKNEFASQGFPESNISLGDIALDIRRLSSNEPDNFFIVQTANRWLEQAKLRPIPKMLFDVFWHEGELCILFADTNLGKSILAVQIGDSISRGEPIKMMRMQAKKQSVLYFDFELSDKQYEARYSRDYTEHYEFASSFYRSEINMDAELPGRFESNEAFLNYSLEKSIQETGAKVVIVDNITYLKEENERARNALPLMKHLKKLKNTYGLSILALAHTPKRNHAIPLNKNDLQGSKMLINFCDSSFVIGESQKENGLRYLKQIKARNTEILFDSEYVIECEIDKPKNFLRFQVLGYGEERNHLKVYSDSEKTVLEENIIELKNSTESLSDREIARRLDTNHRKVARVWKKYSETSPFS